MPSHIQTGALDHFASIWPEGATGVWGEDISPDRKALGWDQERLMHLQNIFLPAKGWETQVDEIVQAHRNDIHILSGIGAYPPVTLAAHLLSRLPNPKMGLIVEPAVILGWKGYLRSIKAKWNYRNYVDLINVVLAMGNQGRDFYLHAGFRADQIVPFLYQCPFGRVEKASPRDDRVRFVYVGQLNHRKGIDQLLKAFLPLADRDDWKLTVYGQGPMKEVLKEFVANHGLSNKISFPGMIQANQVLVHLGQHDVCCVPSRFDGWGVVTNEALQAGIPPIVSSSASSSDLVRYSGVGRVYRSGDIPALSRCLLEYITQPNLVQHEKRLAVSYSPSIMPDTVAGYMKQLFEHFFLAKGPTPLAPWTERHSVSEIKDKSLTSLHFRGKS